jgi:hypothetical protein
MIFEFHDRQRFWRYVGDCGAVSVSPVTKPGCETKCCITTYSSGLYQVEIRFIILTKDVIKGGTWKSSAQLAAQLMEYVKTYNKTRARPFEWTYTRNLSTRTRKSYWWHIANYQNFHKKDPEQTGIEEHQSYFQSMLTDGKHMPGSVL